MEDAEAIVTGEATRATAECATYVATACPARRMPLPSAHNPLPRATRASRLRHPPTANAKELLALYTEALAVNICDTVEFFFRKDTNDGSRRTKCERWGVVYHFEPGEQPTPAPAPAPPAPNP